MSLISRQFEWPPLINAFYVYLTSPYGIKHLLVKPGRSLRTLFTRPYGKAQSSHIALMIHYAYELDCSLLPSAGRKMSTGQSALTLCGWGVKAGMVHSTCG